MSDELQQLFIERFLRFQDRVYGYILTLVANRSDAEELFQQTTLVLWKKWEQFDPARDFVQWACGVAHNEVRNFFRRRDRQNTSLSEALLDQLAETSRDSSGLLEARRAALGRCIETLSAHEQQLVDRCYMGDRTIRDVALDVGQTPNSLYKTLRRIRWALLRCVDRALAEEQA